MNKESVLRDKAVVINVRRAAAEAERKTLRKMTFAGQSRMRFSSVAILGWGG